MKRLLLALTCLLAASCSSETTADKPSSPLKLPEGCQPLLGGHDCMLPYPSDFFLRDDAALPSGKRVEMKGAAKLKSSTGASADVTDWRPLDGFSRIPTIVAVLPGAVSAEGMPQILESPEKSLSPGSATLLIDPDGKLVPHFTDLDPRATDPEKQAIVIHPIVGLRPGARYVVAIHNVKAPDGKLAPAAEGFRRLRDHVGQGDPALDPIAARFDAEVFAPVEKLGVARGEVQLAWEFTTTTGQWATADMLHVREMTIDWIAKHEPKVQIDKNVLDNPAPNVWRELHGKVTVPLFLTGDKPGASLARDASGAVVPSGEAEVPFTVTIPASVRDQFGPGRALAYGHGFFGSQAESTSASGRKIADSLSAVSFAIDWWGMSSADLGSVADALAGKPADMAAFTDRVHQAMASWMVMTAAIRTSLAKANELRRPTDPSAPGVSQDMNGGSNAGALVYDPKPIVYFGASQGHILGGVNAALNPDLARVVLNVGGAGFTQMMMRAAPFSGFLTVLSLSLNDPLDQQKFIATLQGPLDRIDPGSYAPYVLDDKLPGSPADRRVLMQIGLGDVQVPNLASFLHARLLGLGEIAPSAHEIWGLPQIKAPAAQSAVTVYDFGVDTSFYANAEAPSADNPVHEGVRLSAPALDQMNHFYDDGTVIDPCGGPCKVQ